MVPFFGISDADIAEWRRAMGVPEEKSTGPVFPVKYLCEVCQTDIDLKEQYVELEPQPPSTFTRYCHIACLVQHLIKNEDSQEDAIVNYISRKPVCNTETQSSSSPTTSSEDIEDANPFGGL